MKNHYLKKNYTIKIMENNEIKVSRIPKPFSIESLISKQSELSSSPPSPPLTKAPDPHLFVSSPISNFNNHHPSGMLPFPLYSPWIASYLSQQTQQSQLFDKTSLMPQNLDPTNYLLAAHKDRLSQILNTTNNGVLVASHHHTNNNKLSELFSDFSNNYRQQHHNNRLQTQEQSDIIKNNVEIESMDSCSSDISMTPSPDGSCNKHPGT